MTALNYKLKQVIIIYFSQNLKSHSLLFILTHPQLTSTSDHCFALTNPHKLKTSFNNLEDALTPPADLVW